MADSLWLAVVCYLKTCSGKLTGNQAFYFTYELKQKHKAEIIWLSTYSDCWKTIMISNEKMCTYLYKVVGVFFQDLYKSSVCNTSVLEVFCLCFFYCLHTCKIFSVTSNSLLESLHAIQLGSVNLGPLQTRASWTWKKWRSIISVRNCALSFNNLKTDLKKSSFFKLIEEDWQYGGLVCRR